MTTVSQNVGDTREKPMWHQLFELDSGKAQSLQAQLRQALVKAILDGRISVDTPLPSSRGAGPSARCSAQYRGARLSTSD